MHLDYLYTYNICTFTQYLLSYYYFSTVEIVTQERVLHSMYFLLMRGDPQGSLKGER